MIQNVQILPRNDAHWQENEWKKLLSDAIDCPLALLELLNLDPKKLPYSVDLNQKFPQKVPVPFINKMEQGNPFDPLLLQVLPLDTESQTAEGFVSDPLAEQNNKVPGLLHKYKSRVLFMLATHCAINCRYCFRREFPYQENRASKKDWEALGHYIESDVNINEIIISGGDPLAVNDNYLSDFITFIESIPQIKRLRIHTRLPLVIPQRITKKLLNIFNESSLQIVMVIHTNHANELDELTKKALTLLAQSNVHLLNQSVLLKNINDSGDALCELSERLFECKVQPYYLHLLDKVAGSHHFEISEKEAINFVKIMQQNLAGFLVPKLVREVANESSKTLINLTSKSTTCI